MSRIIAVLSGLLLLALCSAGHAQTPPGGGARVALVIGNGAYRSIEALANPRNDAQMIGARLQALGFTLIGDGPLVDLDKDGFERAIVAFRDRMRGAEIALFFYAGHGVQVGGVNWLVPVSAAPRIQSDVTEQMIDANTILAHMRAGGARLNVLVLDACRDNPFPPGTAVGESPRDAQPATTPAPARATGPGPVATRGSGGLGRMDAPDNTLIAYATQPGNVALDGTGGNSPYSKALAETIGLPGLEIRRVFNEVGVRVRRATGGKQQPWLSASPIEREFYLAGRQAANTTLAAAPELLWSVGTWRGRLVDFPSGSESERAYLVGLFDGRLRCQWQARGGAPVDMPCQITSVDVTVPTNVQMLRTPRGTIAGSWRQPTGTAVYKIEMTRISEQVVPWPYLGAATSVSAETRWAIGQWAGRIQDARMGAAARELRIEATEGTLRCIYREVGKDWDPVPCAIVERKIHLITKAGSDVLLSLNGRTLSGTFRLRNSDKLHGMTMQKTQ